MSEEIITQKQKISFVSVLSGNGGEVVMSPELVRWAVKNELGAITYFKYHDRLDDVSKKICRDSYMLNAAKDLSLAEAYLQTGALFAANKIDYVPLKGMGLVRNGIYSNGALRSRSDMDILLRDRTTCVAAMKLLLADGWKQFSNVEDDSFHHLPMLIKYQVKLELHYLLPEVNDQKAIDDFWKNDFRELGHGEYQMSNELHFAVALVHCVIHHDGLSAVKCLTDTALLAQSADFNWEKCFNYCRIMRITAPEAFPGAFPELFPGAFFNSSENSEMIREFFLGNYLPDEVVIMNAVNRFSLSWWKKRLNGFSVSWLRKKYNVPHAGFWQMAGIVCKDYCRKICRGCKFAFMGRAAQVKMERSDAVRAKLGISEKSKIYEHL